MNKVIIMGHVGQNPEVKHFESGTSVANFSVAVTEKFKDKAGNPGEHTEWFKVVAWGPAAKFVETNVTQGSKILIEGKMKTKKWESAGEQKSMQELQSENIHLLTWKKDNF